MLKEVLSEEVVAPGLSARTMEEVIHALLDMLCATGKVRDREEALRSVLANERKTSTGMQHGIAIPHAKTDTVDELVAAVAVTREGVDVRALDGKPARIFIMTLSPRDQTGPHVRFLSEFGRLLKSKSMRNRVLAAGSKAALLEVFTS